MLEDGRVVVAASLATLIGAAWFRGRGSRCGCGSLNCGCNGACSRPGRGSANGSFNCGCGSLLRIAKGSFATTDDVVTAWGYGRPAKASTIRTDGSTLWSYSTIIGETFAHAGKTVYERGDGQMSVTTKKHITKAKRMADRVVSSREESKPVMGIGGPRPSPLGEAVPRPRQAHEATAQEHEWEGRGPWRTGHGGGQWGLSNIVIKNAETGVEKTIGKSSSRGHAWDRATKEAAKRNKAIAAKQP